MPTRLVCGAGAMEQLGQLARELGFRRTLLVADRGMLFPGYVERAEQLLCAERVEVFHFHDFAPDPDTTMVEAGRSLAAAHKIDSIVGLGGGSSLDCAKGINFLLTNGGRIQDYVGYGKATRPMLPMIAMPTTAGTGSEVQSYALLTDAETHAKMACGDPQAAFRFAILDPKLTVSQPREVTATSGFDALTHALETYVSTKRNLISEVFSRAAWRLLEGNYERVLERSDDLAAREAMQLGACYAGIAIENSMLGATHACANPLTAHYGITHGAALAMLLPTVVRWNGSACAERYADLLAITGKEVSSENPAESLAARMEELAELGGLRTNLSSSGIRSGELRSLAHEAAAQWTGKFNPRSFDLAGAVEVYERAF